MALASSPASTQTGGSDVVVVRLVASITRGKLVIVRADGKTEDYSFNAGTGTTNLREGGLTIQRIISSLGKEGYTLKRTRFSWAVL